MTLAISIASGVTASGMRVRMPHRETDKARPESKAGTATANPSCRVTPFIVAAPPETASSTAFYNSRVASHKMLLFMI